jgi:hypothetical protein
MTRGVTQSTAVPGPENCAPRDREMDTNEDSAFKQDRRRRRWSPPLGGPRWESKVKRIGVLVAVAAVAALATLAFASTALGAGYFSGVSARYYSSYVHYIIRYDVYDDAGYCIRDEWGFYEDFDCEDYDSNTATLDVTGYRVLAHSLRYKFSEEISGDHGRATEDVYDFQMRVPYYAKRGTVLHYRVRLRLFDPITDRMLDKRVRDFWVKY